MKDRKLPMCARPYTVGPQTYMRTSGGCSGAKGCTRPVSVLYRPSVMSLSTRAG